VYSEKTDFVDYIYPIELEINENMGTDSSVSYIDLHLVIGNKSGLRTKRSKQKRLFQFSHCEPSMFI
jgi:hypothetical protein